MNTQEEFDLHRFVELFDIAMSSDNPSVKKCLQNLMMVAALVHAEDGPVKLGPMKSLIDEVKTLSVRVRESELRAENAQRRFDNTMAGGIGGMSYSSNSSITPMTYSINNSIH